MSTAQSHERLLSPSVLASIGRLDLIARTIVEGFLIGLHRSPYHGLSQEFAEHRPYIAGDEMRRIDWRVFARTDRLYVKESEEETNAPVRLLLDTSGSLQFTPRDVSKFDYARYLAAAVAYLATRQGDRVGLVCFSEEADLVVPARGGERHLQALLVALERLKAEGRTRIGPTLLQQASQWRRRGVAILISDLYDQTEEIVEAVKRVRRVGHDVIVFHLMDRTERDLDVSGPLEFEDLETGETLLADADKIRSEYVQRVDATRALLQGEFDRSGADYAELDTAAPLDKALAVYLRRRKAAKFKGRRMV